MYFNRDVSFKEKLKQLNAVADKLNIEKDIFTIF